MLLNASVPSASSTTSKDASPFGATVNSASVGPQPDVGQFAARCAVAAANEGARSHRGGVGRLVAPAGGFPPGSQGVACCGFGWGTFRVPKSYRNSRFVWIAVAAAAVVGAVAGAPVGLAAGFCAQAPLARGTVTAARAVVASVAAIGVGATLALA